ncbi:MAG: EcsC family protein [Myxococcaceae bacterium]
MSETEEDKGRQLLTAVERILANTTSLRNVAEDCRIKAKKGAPKNPEALRDAAAAEVVRHFSLRAAIAGGVAGLPALVPGAGSLAVLLGGALAELGYLLKCEVEMVLTLAHLYGFDIDDPKERQIAFLMASVGTYDARSGKNFVADVAEAEGVAIWNYGPRKAAKMVLAAMTALALVWVWRGFARIIPVVGMVIGTSVNKLLTQKVGERAAKDLRTRRELMTERARPAKPAVKVKKRTAAARPRRASRA